MPLEQLAKYFEPFDLSGKRSIKSSTKKEVRKTVQFESKTSKPSFVARIMDGALAMPLKTKD